MPRDGFTGYDYEEVEIGFAPSTGWIKDPSVEAPKSDMIKLPINEVVDPEFTDEKTTVNKIGRKKRTPREYITSQSASLKQKILTNVNFMNVFWLFINSFLGRIKLTLNDSDNFVKTLVTKLLIESTSTTFNSLFTHSIVFVDENGVETLVTAPAGTVDKDAVIALFITGITNDIAGVNATLVDGGTSPDAIAIDTDDTNKFEKIYFETRNTKGHLVDAEDFVIGATLYVASGQEVLLFPGINGTDLQAVAIYEDGATESDPVNLIGLNYITSVHAGIVKLASKLESSCIGMKSSLLNISTIAYIDFDDTPDQMLDFIHRRALNYDEDYESAEGSSAFLLNNALGKGTIMIPLNGTPSIESDHMIDTHYGIKPYDDNYDVTDEFKNVARIGSIREGRCLFPASVAGSGLNTIVSSAIPATLIADTTLNFEVDGYKFSTPFVDSIENAIIALAGEINALNVGRVKRFTATFDATTITIAETQKSSKFEEAKLYIETTATKAKEQIGYTESIPCTSVEYNDDTDFISFNQVLIGDELGVDMKDWCEVGEIEFTLEREVTPLKSVCGTNGRLGLVNTSYTLKVGLTVTDVLSERTYDKYNKYTQNDTFSMMVQSTSGISFVFPKCVFEENSAQENEKLIGRKYTVNVNYDPNTKTALTLPQILDNRTL